MSPPSSGTSKKTESPRRLVVSFHDLHPGSREHCAHFLTRLAGMGVPRASLLVVPRWHGAEPFTRDGVFTRWLRDRAGEGHDVCLHGFFHRADEVRGGPISRIIGRLYTANEGEYFQIDAATARDRIARGLHVLTEEAGLPVIGFTPPAWLLSDDGRIALIEAGLGYTTTLGSVELLQTNTILRAPTIVYSCRAAWRRVMSRAWVRVWEAVNRKADTLRIAAHPCDFDHPSIEASLFERVRRALADGRAPMTYRDLLPGSETPVHGQSSHSQVAA